MQAVGKSCAVCDQRIRTALEGVACPLCRRAFHGDCLDTPDTCRDCGERFDVLELQATVAQHAAADKEARQGMEGEQTIAWAMVAVTVAATAIVAWTSEPRPLPDPRLGFLALLMGLYLVVCSMWARTFALYHLKVRRLFPVLGELGSHALYRALGLLLMGFGVLVVIERLPF